MDRLNKLKRDKFLCELFYIATTIRFQQNKNFHIRRYSQNPLKILSIGIEKLTPKISSNILLTGSRHHADRELAGHLVRRGQVILYLGDVDLPVASLAQEDHHVPVAGHLRGVGARNTSDVGRRRGKAPGQDRDREPPTKTIPGHGPSDPDRDVTAITARRHPVLSIRPLSPSNGLDR